MSEPVGLDRTPTNICSGETYRSVVNYTREASTAGWPPSNLCMQWLAILFALLAGAANPFQAGTNAELKTQFAQPIWATLWVYASGLLGVLLVQAFVRQPLPDGTHIHAVPWWGWAGGIISILATFAALMFAQQLGAGAFTGISITMSTIISIAMDHYGMLGFKQHAASPLRIAGGVLMIAGIWMVTKF